jgi:FkbM family methyltransferase
MSPHPKPLRHPVSGVRQVVKFTWNHPANRGHRLEQLGRAARFQIVDRAFHRERVVRLGDRSLVYARHGTNSAKVVYANVPEWPEMQVWRSRLGAGDLFVDVGANVGLYTVLASDLGAEVIAIEPDPAALLQLRRNVDLNDLSLSVQIFEGVLSDRAGVTSVTTGLGLQNHLLGEDLSDEGRMVEATTLDATLGDRFAAGVKVDVEGAEHLVLSGCRRALEEHRIALLQLEWNSLSEEHFQIPRAETAELLESFGYQLARPTDRGELEPVTDPACGRDVFAYPASSDHG